MQRILKGAQLVGDTWVVKPPEPEIGVPDLATGEAVPDPQAILADVQLQIDEMVRQATAEVEAMREQVRQEAYEEGFAQGRRDAEQAALAQWQPLMDSAQAAIAQLKDDYQRHLQEAEPQLVSLALMVAAKILRKEASRPEVAQAVLREALNRLSGEAPARIRVNPFDHPRLSAPQGAELIADPAVGAGGVIIETPQGKVDARFATQFREIARALLEREEPLLAPEIEDLQADA